MASKKLSELVALAVEPAVDDEIYIRDISELASAESKKITVANLMKALIAHKATHENGGGDEISVAALSGLLADDQHVLDAEAVSAMGAKADVNALNHDKYTDAEAKAASVLAGAITNAETKAPTHDAVYDVKVTADAAQTAAEVDADITTHNNVANAHGAVSAATASKIVVRDAQGQAKFAAPAASGDALIKGTQLTATEMLRGTADYVLTGQGAANPVYAAPAGGGASLTIGDTNVYSDVAATSWTDLDISAVVGSNSAMVMLKVTTTVSNMGLVAFRRNGDTDEFLSSDAGIYGLGAASAYLKTETAAYAVLIVATDSSGVIEWKGQYSSGGQVVIIDVMAYIK